MTDKLNYLTRTPWETPAAVPGKKQCYYICISGNSGAGKSTLLNSIAGALFQRDKYTIGIDEKNLHHPFLASLFFEAHEYGFQLQLNFMLQRTLLAKRWLDLGYNVVMERSHLEDPIFINHFKQMGYIDDNEYDVYMNLWDALDRKLRHPDVILFLNVPPEVSIKRIDDDENSGKRPCEFPDQQTKEIWIRSWHQNYVNRFAEIAGSKRFNTHIIELDEKTGAENETIVKRVFDRLGL